jgi:hypothetical protein
LPRRRKKKKKRFSVAQIVDVLKQVELGVPVAELIRQVRRKSLKVSFADGSVLTAAAG